MVRRRRPYLPGAVFHLTARTQGHQPWFLPSMRDGVAKIVESAVVATDAGLLAYAIMPNHLHLVVRQGNVTLGYLMQMLLRRVALLVQRAHGIGGHVFERRYRDQPCLDPEYVRNAIVYTHLNPVRAGLCEDASDYPWSSHRTYCANTPPPGPDEHIEVRNVLSLFATAADRTLAELRADYQGFVDWRVAVDGHRSLLEADVAAVPPPPEPDLLHGDRHWLRNFARSADRSPSRDAVRAWSPVVDRPSLSDLARQVLAEHDAPLPTSAVKGRHGGARTVGLRHAIIRRAARAGYRGVEIARFLKVTESAVSKVVASMHTQSATGSNGGR